MPLEGMAEKSANNIINGIKQSLEKTLSEGSFWLRYKILVKL